MKVKTAAKINLLLDVMGKLPNGYHTIESVFQTIGIYDEITVELTKGDISLSCDVPEQFAASSPIPCDERNIAYKAARKFFDENGLDTGCNIHIKKGIPSQAGMGGGSTDAAAVIYCLKKLTGKNFSAPEKLGADVPFFLTGGTAYIEGIGEKITPISDYSGRILVIGKGTQGVSTAEAYKAIDSLENPVHPDAKAIVNAINNCPDKAYKYIGNLFDAAVKLEEIADVKNIMLSNNANGACMTGSGSAIFGIFDTMKNAEKCSEALKAKGYYSEICETVKDAFIEI